MKKLFSKFLLIICLPLLTVLPPRYSWACSSTDWEAHAIESILPAWFALNTYVIDNKLRQPREQSLGYRELADFFYDVGQMVHVLDCGSSPEATKFIIGLVSYQMVDGAISEEIFQMIRERGDASRDAARKWLSEPESPCAHFYNLNEKQLFQKPLVYCMEDKKWRAFLKSELFSKKR